MRSPEDRVRGALSRHEVAEFPCPEGTREYRELTLAIRRHCGGSRRPIVVVPGRAAPSLQGEGYRYETPGGHPVTYPNAYRRAYGRPVYIASTLRVVVGAAWVRARLAKIVRAGNRRLLPVIVRRMLAAA